MGIRLSQVMDQTAKADVLIGDDLIEFVYFPNRVTTSMIMKLEAEEINLVDLISTCLSSWNLDGPDDQPLPTDREGVEQIPAFLLGEIAQALLNTTKGEKPGEAGGSFGSG